MGQPNIFIIGDYDDKKLIMIRVTDDEEVEEIANLSTLGKPYIIRSVSLEYYILRDDEGISLVKQDNLSLTSKQIANPSDSWTWIND